MRTPAATAPKKAEFPSEPQEPSPSGVMEVERRRSKRRLEAQNAREALHQALARIEAIASQTPDEDLATRLWRRLVRGGWSLVAEFELDGRRYYLLNEDGFVTKRRDALTRRERRIFHFVELGLSNKSIAYSLGVSPSTVATLLHSARKKFRRTFRMELASRLEREAKKHEGNRKDSAA